MNNNLKYLLKINSADTVDHENTKTDHHEKFPQLQIWEMLENSNESGIKTPVGKNDQRTNLTG